MKSLGGTIKFFTAIGMFMAALTTQAFSQKIDFEKQDPNSKLDRIITAYFSEFLDAHPRTDYSANVIDLNDDQVAEIAVRFDNNKECDRNACRTVLMIIKDGKPFKIFDANTKNVSIIDDMNNGAKNLYVDNKYTFKYVDGRYRAQPMINWKPIRLRAASEIDPRLSIAYDEFMKNYAHIVNDTGVQPKITLGEAKFNNQGAAALVVRYNHESICSSFYGCPIFILQKDENDTFKRIYEGYSTDKLFLSGVARGTMKDIIISSRDRFTELRYNPVTKTLSPENSSPRIYYIGN